MNRRMFEKVKRSDAIDLSGSPRTEEGYYKLGDFLPGIDYCDLRNQRWIWSIGRHKTTGKILASPAKTARGTECHLGPPLTSTLYQSRCYPTKGEVPMSLRLLPNQEIEDNPDYQRWQFEVQKAEWEAEQQPSCLHPVARLTSLTVYRGYSKRVMRTASCRVCGQVLAGEID